MSISFFAQAQHLGSSKGKVALGLGFGLPYGGFGGRVSVNPGDQVAIFGGVGYNTLELGYNAGLQYVFPSHKQTELFVTAMYGYNTVVQIEGTTTYDKSYNGLSTGLGIRVNSNRHERVFWDFGVLVPVRSSDFREDWNLLEKNSFITGLAKPFPVLFYGGFNFILPSKERD